MEKWNKKTVFKSAKENWFFEENIKAMLFYKHKEIGLFKIRKELSIFISFSEDELMN